MLKRIFLFYLAISCLNLSAQQILLPYSKDNWFGYMNEGFEPIISPQFEAARPFSQACAAVKIAGKWGYINREGVLIIAPNFKHAKAFSDGFAQVSCREELICTSSYPLWETIDKKGHTVSFQKSSKQLSNHSLYTFEKPDAKGRYVHRTANGKFQLRNIKGETLSALSQDLILRFNDYHLVLMNDFGRKALADFKGQLITDFKDWQLHLFSKNCVFYQQKINRKYFTGMLNGVGEIILAPSYDFIEAINKEYAFLLNQEAGRFLKGLIDTHGELILPPYFEEIWVIHDNLFLSKTPDTLYTSFQLNPINFKQSSTNAPLLEKIDLSIHQAYVSDTLLKTEIPIVQKGNQFWIAKSSKGSIKRNQWMKKNGFWFLEETQIATDSFYLAPQTFFVKKANHWGTQDDTGHPIINAVFEELSLVNQNALLGKRGNRAYLLNPKGKRIFKEDYLEIIPINFHSFFVRKLTNRKWYFVNQQEEQLIDFICDELVVGEKEVYALKRGKFQYYDAQGNLLWETGQATN